MIAVEIFAMSNRLETTWTLPTDQTGSTGPIVVIFAPHQEEDDLVIFAPHQEEDDLARSLRELTEALAWDRWVREELDRARCWPPLPRPAPRTAPPAPVAWTASLRAFA